jgi:hypothetical protein
MYFGGQARTPNLRRWLSHVRNFHDESTDPDKRFYHGPANQVTGADLVNIVNTAYTWVCSVYTSKESPPEIDLIGHSRGAVGVADLAVLLANRGCTNADGCRVPVNRIRFLGTYDPVMLILGRMNNVPIPAIVQNMRNVTARSFVPHGQMSRPNWPRDVFNVGAVGNYGHITVAATHGGIGGAPTCDSEKNLVIGYSDITDRLASINADQWMRSQASALGVPIGPVADYDFAAVVPWP